MTSSTSSGIATRLVNSCLSYITGISSSKFKIKRLKEVCLADISHQFSRFKLWAHTFQDLPHDLENNQNFSLDPLDAVLEQAMYLKEPTTNLLSELSSCLLSKHLKAFGSVTLRVKLEETLHEATQLFPDAKIMLHEEDSNIELLIEDLKGVLDNLFELSSSLNDVLEEIQMPRESDNLSISLAYREVYLRYIRDNFPYAKDNIIETFAEGNVHCRDRLISLGTKSNDTRTAVAATPTAPVIKEAPISDPQNLSVPHFIPPTPANNPQQVDRGDVPLRAGSLVSSRQPTSFHDSGVGTSISANSNPAQTFLAPPPSVSGISQTTACSIESTAQNRPRVPAMPKDSRSPLGFTCYVCHQKQPQMFRPRQWRKHLFSDLSSYMCINKDCEGAQLSFRTRNEWITHDRTHGDISEASKTLQCHFCLKEFSHKTSRYYSHVGHHMEDIRLFALPLSYQDTGIEDDFDNSSETGESSSSVRRKGDLSTIPEDDGLTVSTLPTQLSRYLNENSTIDRGFLNNWIAGESSFEAEIPTSHPSIARPTQQHRGEQPLPTIVISGSPDPAPTTLPIPNIRESKATFTDL